MIVDKVNRQVSASITKTEGNRGSRVAGAVVSPIVVGLVLTSAAMHAYWNALLKGGTEG
jgi:hypothetical protein